VEKCKKVEKNMENHVSGDFQARRTSFQARQQRSFFLVVPTNGMEKLVLNFFPPALGLKVFDLIIR
jgi:hypothetical protein